MNTPQETNKGHLLTLLNVWGLSFGCAVGWGAFMLPGNLFLPNAGPVGSILAIILGGLIMLIIGSNFCMLAGKMQDSGGFFAYTREIMGHDHAFLAGWALIITYLSIMWANATAVIVLVRFTIGDVLQWGFHYQVAGFDVYGGEIIATWGVIILFGLFSAFGGGIKQAANTILAFILIGGIVILFCGVLAMSPQHASFYPAFDPDVGGTPFLQLLSILMVAPWMFFGYESITHGSKQFHFPTQYMFPLIIATVVSTVLAYCLPIAIAVMGIPPEYHGWNEYINNLGNLEGLKALPLFYSVKSLLGSTGLGILIAAILAGILTGIIGLYRGASYLLQAMAQDNLLPAAIAEETKDGTPRNAIISIMIVSLLIPLLGRTAIVWLVDAITISGSIAYAYVSLCRYREATVSKDSAGKFLGITGFIISIFFFFCPIIPNLLIGTTLNTESYLLLAVWSIIGLIYYWYIFKHDKHDHFGKSFSMCTVLLFLNFFTSSLWLRQMMVTKLPLLRQSGYAAIHEVLNTSSIIQIVIIILILVFMGDIFTIMRQREYQLNIKVQEEQHTSQVRNSFLIGMTHDIGLMMQSIMSYVRLARNTGKEYETIKGNCPQDRLDSLWQALRHTDSVSHHFLNLVREMGLVEQITSNHLVLYPRATDIHYSLQQVKNIFVIQMQDKNLDFQVDSSQLDNSYVYCDENRIQRMLLNLISLAYDVSPMGGTISVSVTQKGFAHRRLENKGELGVSSRLCADYELKVNFTADKERMDKLSMDQRISITKHLVSLMEGAFSIESSPAAQTEMSIQLTLNLAKQSAVSYTKYESMA
ncbi:amino acid permease [Anaerovibrio lipolyticus]|uniref:amino acid permease n=1 Tax=Anaerovibrio lipolyticus TaxID=82374 RepID=UPI0026F37C40|nr:amino acid permease [Anaerovibrio lipolyticus]MBE6106942.1 amino acid permease [Anaerovibrio lipolyticus]